MDKKIKFSLGLLIFILILLAAELIYYQKIKNQASVKKEIVTQEITPVPQKLTNLEIAKKVLGCLDKTMRDERGIFATGKECSSSIDCDITGESSRVGLYVLWGRTKFVEKTGDQIEKNNLMRDIDLYLDRNKVMFIQPDFRSKIFLYQMWKSKIFSQEENQKVQELIKKVYPGQTKKVIEIIRSINDGDYKEPNFNEFLNNPNRFLLSQDKETSRDNYRKDIMFSSDYLFQYLLEKDDKYLKLAKKLIYDSLGEYQLLKDELMLEDKYLLALTFAEFYNNLKEKVFMDISLILFEREKMEDKCWITSSCPKNASPLAIYILLAKELYQIIENEKYLDLASEALNYLININFDEQKYGGFETGDGCFYNLAGADKKLRTTSENGLMVGILSME